MTVEAPETLSEHDEILAAMQGMLHHAPEPAGLEVGEVINDARGNDEMPVPMIGASVTSAGYCYVWNRQTGERSAINMNGLPAQLKKRNVDGSLAFTTVKPKVEAKRGKLKCLLHRDDPQRKVYDQWGLPTCPKDNLTSPYMVAQHMSHRHKNEWATIERERAEMEKREDLKRSERHQRELVAALAGRVKLAETQADPEDLTLDDSPRHRGRRARTAVEA